MQRAAAKCHHHPGKSCQRHRDLSGGRQGFTWFHRFGLDRIQLARTNTNFRRVGCLKRFRSLTAVSASSSVRLLRFNALTIQPFDVREAKTRTPFSFPWVFLAIRSMSAIGIICHWNLVSAAATRFQSSIIIAVIVLPHRLQFRRGPLMRNTCSE